MTLSIVVAGINSFVCDLDHTHCNNGALVYRAWLPMGQSVVQLLEQCFAFPREIGIAQMDNNDTSALGRCIQELGKTHHSCPFLDAKCHDWHCWKEVPHNLLEFLCLDFASCACRCGSVGEPPYNLYSVNPPQPGHRLNHILHAAVTHIYS